MNISTGVNKQDELKLVSCDNLNMCQRENLVARIEEKTTYLNTILDGHVLKSATALDRRCLRYLIQNYIYFLSEINRYK